MIPQETKIKTSWECKLCGAVHTTFAQNPPISCYNDCKGDFVLMKYDASRNKEIEKNIEKIARRIKWEDLIKIDSFLIYEGSERIYDIIIDGKKIRLEGKEIMDYNTFRLKYFECFGILLPTFRGVGEFWANLITTWNNNFGKIISEKTEDISESTEAKQLIIDYINNCSVTDAYVIKQGIATLRENFIYVPTKIIKKLLKREGFTISLRKLAYELDDYIYSGSIPLKVENRSERFWKFILCKFELDITKKLEIQEGKE